MSLRPVRLPEGVGGALWLSSMPGRFEPWPQFLAEATRVNLTQVVCLTPRDELAELIADDAVATAPVAADDDPAVPAGPTAAAAPAVSDLRRRLGWVAVGVWVRPHLVAAQHAVVSLARPGPVRLGIGTSSGASPACPGTTSTASTVSSSATVTTAGPPSPTPTPPRGASRRRG